MYYGLIMERKDLSTVLSNSMNLRYVTHPPNSYTFVGLPTQPSNKKLCGLAVTMVCEGGSVGCNSAM